jgi:TetR/AcrR family transcriptional repressor of nem operon
MTTRAELTRSRLLDAAKGQVMSKGFAGTSIDDILKQTGLTKGAFFHHFKGKADLARELVKSYALGDLKMFQEFDQQSQEQGDDPLEQVMIFLALFEEYISKSEDPAPGCMYAVYTYESRQFDPDVLDFVSDTLRQWTSIYVRKFQNVLDRYDPALPITARELAEMIVSVIEGGLVLQRAHGDTDTTRRQSKQFRNYLTLLFPAAETGAPGAPETTPK